MVSQSNLVPIPQHQPAGIENILPSKSQVESSPRCFPPSSKFRLEMPTHLTRHLDLCLPTCNMFRYPGNTQVTNVGCCQNTATVDHKKGPLQNLSLLALLILWFVNNISKPMCTWLFSLKPKGQKLPRRNCIRALGVYISQGETSTPHIKGPKFWENQT